MRKSVKLAILFLAAGLMVSLPCDVVFSDDAYLIRPGDKLNIQVYREKDLSGIFSVNASGNMNYPLLGEIRVEGLLLDEFKDFLKESLGKSYLVNPQIQVDFEESPSKSVAVFGQVAKGGNYILTPNMTLVRLVSQVGGFAPDAATNDVRIARIGDDGKKKFLHVDVTDIMKGLAEDVSLRPGDSVFVDKTENLKDTVAVLGQVNKPGNYNLTPGLTLVRLISEAGGFTATAAPNSVKIVRTSKGGKKDSFLIDVDNVITGKAKDWLLEANDIVNVDKGEGVIGSVAILGQISKPGNYEYKPNLTLVRLISESGGFTPTAAPNRVRVVRAYKDGREKTFLIDTSRIMNGQDKDVKLEPGDLVVVPESYF